MADGRRILLLDDSWISLELTRDGLERRGHKVALAKDLTEFRERLTSFEPEVILTDLLMPDISGKDIVKVLKQDFHTEKIPIILYSSKSEEELSPIADLAGADGFISKSEGMDRLCDLVDELVASILW